MCGVAGIFHSDGKPVPIDVLKRMGDAVKHRGPDGEGFWVDGFVGFAHRRLAILDLSPSGHQPMQTEDGRFVITYNGEIYNHLNLRIELESLGHQFHSRTDTEVVLKSFKEWGPDCLSRFNGMFAFAVWDKQAHRLYLARDRYGIKPLYYFFNGNTLVFGSEVKSILKYPDLKVNVSEQALHEYFAFQNIYSELTFFEGVKTLPAGHFMFFDLGSTKIPCPNSYWDFNFSEDSSIDEKTAAEETARLFEQAVQRQLLADVEVGSYLSGGMDSGSVAALAARSHRNLKTFTCGFDLSSATGLEQAYDERAKAEVLSHRFKTEQYEVVLKAGDMERVMSDLTWHLEDPRVGQSYPNFYISRLASKFVKVVLCGTGGDEVFAGYPWRYYSSIQKPEPQHFMSSYFQFWQRLVPNDHRSNFFLSSFRNSLNRPEQVFKSIFKNLNNGFKDFAARDFLNEALYFEAKTFLHGLLIMEDKLSMAHGLETRLPFLDNDLVDFAQKIPVKYKLQYEQKEPFANAGGHLSTSDGKLVLRNALSKILPKEYTSGVKQGFSAPDASWFKGESIEYIKQLLLNKNARIYEFLDYKTCFQLLDDHFSGRTNRRLLIWSLLSFEWWNRVFRP